MLDPSGREITYLRISVIDRCNLSCWYCVPNREDKKRLEPSTLLTFDQIYAIVAAGAALGITKIRLTGGEPLLREQITYLIAQLAMIPGIRELTMTTNGILLEHYAHDLNQAGLNRINVSLDSLNAERYAEITGGGDLNRVLAGIEAAKQEGFPVTINTVVSNDSSEEEIYSIRTWCDKQNFSLHLIQQFDLKQEKKDNHHFDRPPLCSFCNRLRILSNGVIKPCLHSELEIPIIFDDIKSSLMEAVYMKPIHGSRCTNRSMLHIGG